MNNIRLPLCMILIAIFVGNVNLLAAPSLAPICALLLGSAPQDSVPQDGVPRISSVSGTIGNGNTIQINGVYFGVNSHNVEWLGNNIEEGTSGQEFSKSDWRVNLSNQANTYYASDDFHSGSQSLKVSPSSPDNYGGIFEYALAEPFNANEVLFFSYWVRYDGSDLGQWKMIKINGAEDIWSDQSREQIAIHNWPSSSKYVYTNPTASDYSKQTFYASSSVFPRVDGVWNRFDVEIHASSPNLVDGEIILTRRDGSSKNSQKMSDLNGIPGGKNYVPSHLSGDSFTHIVWQNYVGNGNTGADIWFDDIFVQNSVARVELSSSSTWSNDVDSNIQPHISWSNNVITIELNQGSFDGGKTVYLYVINENGVVNENGYPITFNSN